MARCENKMENRGLRWSKRVRWKIGEIKSKMENRGLRQSSVESKMENRGDTPRHDLGAAPRKWRRDRQKCSHTWLLTVLEDCSWLLIPILNIWLLKLGACHVSGVRSLGTYKQKIVIALLTKKSTLSTQHRSHYQKLWRYGTDWRCCVVQHQVLWCWSV